VNDANIVNSVNMTLLSELGEQVRARGGGSARGAVAHTKPFSK